MYHLVFVPKYRQKKLYGKFRRKVGEIKKAVAFLKIKKSFILNI